MTEMIYTLPCEDEPYEESQTKFVICCGGKILATYLADWCPEIGDAVSILGHMGSNYLVKDLTHIIDPSEGVLSAIEIRVILTEKNYDTQRVTGNLAIRSVT